MRDKAMTVRDDDEMVMLTVEIPDELMKRLNRVTEAQAERLGLRANRARSAIVRQMLRKHLDTAESELGLAAAA